MESLSGRTIKGYELRELLSAGGFGAVYRAYQPQVDREVAVKIILPQHANQPEFIRRFETEARLVARLEHPHIVPLYDYWRDPEGAFLVMRYLRGRSLAERIDGRPLPLDALARVFEQIGDALAVAHRRDVIHRDIKPANILLDEHGNAYLADFGIAKDLGQGGARSTDEGAAPGSPAYMAPEQIRSEPLTNRTDIYSLAIVLYEALTGELPFQATTPILMMFKHIHEPPPLDRRRPDLPPALNAVIRRGVAKDPDARYPDVASFVRDLQHALGLAGAAPAPPDAPQQSRYATQLLDAVLENPYKGLRAFDEADAGEFFGREALTRRLLGRMAEMADFARFLAVVGPSGSGKSSVVRAGLLPALRSGALAGSQGWFIVEMRPGAQPLAELEAALLRVAVRPPAPELLRGLHERDDGLRRLVPQLLEGADGADLVLFIDQFEEAFTLCADEAVRARFLQTLYDAVDGAEGRLRVIITLRADFYDRPLLVPSFGALMRARTEVALPLSADELGRAIRAPAERAGALVDPELSAAIVADIREQPGALPLLQYALTELFERRSGRVLTRDSYLAIGGMFGALARRAEDTFLALDADGQAAARQVFLRLVALGEGVEDTRRRARRAELQALVPPRPGDARPEPLVDAVLAAYDRARLLTFDHDPSTRAPTVEVAHEALIRAWPRLREWVDGSRTALRVQRQLNAAAAEWRAAAGDPSFLASGARLAQFSALADSQALALSDDEAAYLAASVAEGQRMAAAEHERQARELELARQSARSQRAAANRLRVLAGALGLFLLLAAGLALFAFQQRRVALSSADAAASAAATASANLARSDALRLASEAEALRATNGAPELAALLALRSLKLRDTDEGYAALAAADALAYPSQTLPLTDAVGYALFGGDGRELLINRADGRVQLWDTAARQARRTLATGTHLWKAVLSPDGELLLAITTERSAALWDIATGRELHTFALGRPASLLSVDFSHDGRRLVVASDTTVGVWEPLTGAQLASFSQNDDQIAGVAFSADDSMILTASLNATIRFWDLGTRRLVRSLPLAGDASGRVGGSISAFDFLEAAAFAPNRGTLATGRSDGTVQLWDVTTGRALRVLGGHADRVNRLAFSPDGRQLLSAGADGTARLWDVRSGAELRRFTGHGQSIQNVAFSPDGADVLTNDDTVRLWHTQAPSAAGAYPTRDVNALPAAFGADDSQLLVADPVDGASIQLRSLADGALVSTFSNGGGGDIGAVSPDGRLLVFRSYSEENSFQLWNIAERRRVGALRSAQPITLFGFSIAPGNALVAATASDNAIHLWDVASGKERATIAGGDRSLAFAPDGAALLVIGDMVRVLDVRTGAQRLSFGLGGARATVAAWSPDGRHILTGDDQGQIVLWDAASGQRERAFAGHAGPVLGLAFSPNGARILSGGADKTARLWDAASGAELRRLGGHARPLNMVAFSPGGKYLLTADAQAVRVWYADARDLAASVCARLTRDLSAAERARYAIDNDAPTC